MQIVYFYQSNAGGIVHAAYDRGVVARWQLRNDGRLPAIARSVAAVEDVAHLAGGNDPADYRRSPIIVRGNQSSCAVVQLQCRIGECIGNAIWDELRTNSTHNYPLWSGPLNNETANDHVVACLHEGARADVG